jgi:ubiquinone/menaquinone biosynthesis C-methylase UbiE
VSDLRAYFENLAWRWDDLQSSNREAVLNRLLAQFAPLLGASTNILEVGTGTGALIPCLRAASPKATLVSIDLAGRMLRRARQRCPDAMVVQADVHLAPFVPQQFDLVICHNSFPHFADLLILHDLSREAVNAIHSSGGTAIQNDLLPAGEEVRRMLMQAGFVDGWVEDTDEHYIVSVQA